MQRNLYCHNITEDLHHPEVLTTDLLHQYEHKREPQDLLLEKQTGKQLIHACPEDRQTDKGDDSGQNCMTCDLEATELELFA